MIWISMLAAVLAGSVPVHAVPSQLVIGNAKGAIVNSVKLPNDTLPGGPSIAPSNRTSGEKIRPLDTLPGGPSH